MRLKKGIIGFGILLLSNITVLAGSIDYLSQQDAEYLAHPSMTGKIGISGAYYNPAGTVWLDDGLYLQLNTQTIFKDYGMSINGKHFDSDRESPVVPSMQIVKKKDDTSYFLHTGAIAGGGSVAYEGGLGAFEAIANELSGSVKRVEIMPGKYINFPLGKVEYLGGNTSKGQSYYTALQVGMAKKVTDTLSLSAGVRVVHADRKLRGYGDFTSQTLSLLGKDKIRFDIDSERTAFGVTGILGADYHPNDKLNLAVRYETETSLDFKTKEKNLSPFMETLLGKHPVVKEWIDGEKGHRNLPAMASAGVSYKVTDKTTLLASGNYYFIKGAKDDFGAYDGYDNGYETAVGIDHEITPKVTLMAGYQYTKTGANKKTYKDTDYALNANMYSVGAKYKLKENTDVMASYSFVDYKTAKNESTNIEYKKKVNAIGLAVAHKF